MVMASIYVYIYRGNAHKIPNYTFKFQNTIYLAPRVSWHSYMYIPQKPAC